MPNTKSAKKRLRQNVFRRLRNRSARSSLRTQVRKVREAVAGGQLEEAEKQFQVASKKLDQAGAKRLIHPNTASRLKSRLSHLIHTHKRPAQSPGSM
ncbi:MAG: 30S ribosomal protein S20 [Pirellulaceae bacterium]|nr:30S ribosomal protein S20 [Pirellulaceae bacterium]